MERPREIIDTRIDPVSYAEEHFSINFPAIFKTINGASDIFFFGFLFFDEAERANSSAFIVSAAIFSGVFFRLIGSFHYTDKAPSTATLTLINILFGGSFKVHKGTSFKRSHLQYFPLNIQIIDQANAHQIGDRFQIMLSLYASILVTFASNARYESNFYFYLVKAVIIFITLTIELLGQGRYMNNLISALPYVLSYAIAPVFYNYSLLYTLPAEEITTYIRLEFLTSFGRFMIVFTLAFVRLSSVARETFFQRKQSYQAKTGGFLVFILFVLLFWDVVALGLRIGPDIDIGSYSEILANLVVGFICCVSFSCIWRHQVFQNPWIDAADEALPEALVSLTHLESL